MGRDRADLTDPRLLLQLYREVDGIELAAMSTGADDAGSDRTGEMDLADARAPYQH